MIKNLPLDQDQEAFLRLLAEQVNVKEENIISRIQLNTGKDDIINVVPNPVDTQVFNDYELTYFPGWNDLRVMVITDDLLPQESYKVEGYEYFNIRRSFLGNKIVVDMGVRFD